MTHVHRYGWNAERDDRGMGVGHANGFHSQHLVQMAGAGNGAPPRQSLSAPAALGPPRGPPPPPPPNNPNGRRGHLSQPPAPNAQQSGNATNTAAWSSLNGGHKPQQGSSSRQAEPSSFSDKRVEFMLKCAALKDNEFKPGVAANGQTTSTSPSPVPLRSGGNNGEGVRQIKNYEKEVEKSGNLFAIDLGLGPGLGHPSATGPLPRPRGGNGPSGPFHHPKSGPASQRVQPFVHGPNLRAVQVQQQGGPPPSHRHHPASATICLIKYNEEMEAHMYEQSGKDFPYRSPLDWREHHNHSRARKMGQKRPHGGLILPARHSALGPPLSGSIYLGGGPRRR